MQLPLRGRTALLLLLLQQLLAARGQLQLQVILVEEK
jgi:hypothetical protein